MNTTYNNTLLLPACVVCHAPALARCPGCHRPFCSSHAAVSGWCADCELSRAHRVERTRLILLSIYTISIATAVVSLGLFNIHLAIVAGAFGALGGVLVSALAGRIARGPDRAWAPVEGAALEVGSEAGPPRVRRLGRWVAGRQREKDQYQAAYNAGFNRVQGCA
jgi:hypothetical protein